MGKLTFTKVIQTSKEMEKQKKNSNFLSTNMLDKDGKLKPEFARVVGVIHVLAGIEDERGQPEDNDS